LLKSAHQITTSFNTPSGNTKFQLKAWPANLTVGMEIERKGFGLSGLLKSRTFPWLGNDDANNCSRVSNGQTRTSLEGNRIWPVLGSIMVFEVA